MSIAMNLKNHEMNLKNQGFVFEDTSGECTKSGFWWKSISGFVVCVIPPELNLDNDDTIIEVFLTYRTPKDEDWVGDDAALVFNL